MRNKWIARVLVLAVIVGVFMGFGFRVNHLQGGIGSALGSAQSSLAVYKHGTSAEVGSKIIVNVKDSGPELGIVKSATDTTVDVDLGDNFIRVEKSEVLGKLIAVIPFFGSVMGIVGL
ncbi:unannotated protein [freshwater metagenome]|uniref:Unannotated protein n=1 Tax=freshwater metagenome TaxID=449393 RepID=A0A6J6EHE3_9ZZZZ|nr:hypothetical protein [Actinomycetota bacterium]